MFEEVTASSLIKVDVSGNPVDPTPFITNPAGFTIHSAIHMAREDAHAVMHVHTPAGQAVSAHSEGLLPLTQTAMLVRGDLAFHDYEGVAVDLGERERLVADLGAKNLMLLRNHGTLAVGKSVGECFVRLYFLERACQAQIMALSAGDAINNPPQGSPEITAQQGAGRGRARRQSARLAGAQAQGLSPRPELRELSWQEGGQRQRLPRARQGAAAAFPVRISRRRFVRRSDAAAECRGSAGGRAAAARAARCFGDRPFDRTVRAALGDAGGPGPGRALRALCAAGRSAGGTGGRGGECAVLPLDFQRLLDRGSREGRQRTVLVPAVHRQGPRFCQRHDRAGKAAGCGALLLTVDLAVPGTRYRDYRAGMSGSMRGSGSRMRQVLQRPDWAWDVARPRASADHGQPRDLAWHGRGAGRL